MYSSCKQLQTTGKENIHIAKTDFFIMKNWRIMTK